MEGIRRIAPASPGFVRIKQSRVWSQAQHSVSAPKVLAPFSLVSNWMQHDLLPSEWIFTVLPAVFRAGHHFYQKEALCWVTCSESILLGMLPTVPRMGTETDQQTSLQWGGSHYSEGNRLWNTSFLAFHIYLQNTVSFSCPSRKKGLWERDVAEIKPWKLPLVINFEGRSQNPRLTVL